MAGDGLGVKNLEMALSRHSRTLQKDNWVVGANATVSTIPVLLANPAGTAVNITGETQTNLKGAEVEFRGVKGFDGYSRIITSADADGTLHLDSPLDAAPPAGTKIMVSQLANINATVTAPEDIASVGGTAQTGADWTVLLQSLSNAIDTLNAKQYMRVTNAPVEVANLPKGTAVVAGTGVLGVAYSPPVAGTINISVALDTGATASAFQMTRDGTNYYSFNGGTNLSAGDWYTFSIAVNAGDEVNFTTSAGTTLGSLGAYFMTSQ